MKKSGNGNSYEDIASSAYKAYSINKGESLCEWDYLPQDIKTAWEAAARQVIDIWDCSLIGDCVGWTETIPDEQRWNGWVPPRIRKQDKNTNSTSKAGV